MLKDNNQTEGRISINCKKEIQYIPLSNITHITCDSYLSTIHFLDKKQKICVAKLLKEFEKELVDKGFIRINHNAIVNIKCICSFDKEKRCLTFNNNEQCFVSVRKVKNIKKYIK